jgi:phage terminase small subunit
MSKRLTTKQKAFAEEYIRNGGNGTQAAMKSYDTESYKTASAISVENLEKPLIIEELVKTARRLGVTEEKIVSPVIDALDSQDLDMRLKGHDRMIKMLNGKDNGLSLNIENASGIEISFKNFGGKNDKSTPGSDA